MNVFCKAIPFISSLGVKAVVPEVAIHGAKESN